MRTLKFIVNGQVIEKDPNCDFTGLVPGSEGYLKAEFAFSSDWNNCVKVAQFHYLRDEFPPQVLTDGKTCMIPAEAAARRSFKIKIIGKKNDDYKLTTNSVAVVQDGNEIK